MTMSYRPLLSATERSLIRLVVPRLALQARPYSLPFRSVGRELDQGLRRRYGS